MKPSELLAALTLKARNAIHRKSIKPIKTFVGPDCKLYRGAEAQRMSAKVNADRRAALAECRKQAAARAKANAGKRTDLPQKSAEGLKPIETREEIAKIAVKPTQAKPAPVPAKPAAPVQKPTSEASTIRLTSAEEFSGPPLRMTRAEFAKLSPKDRSRFCAEGGRIVN